MKVTSRNFSADVEEKRGGERVNHTAPGSIMQPVTCALSGPQVECNVKLPKDTGPGAGDKDVTSRTPAIHSAVGYSSWISQP